MGIFRPTYTTNGKTCRSRTYWLEFQEENVRRRVNLHTTEKRSAERVAGKILRRVEKRAAGLIDPFEESMEKPLMDHVADFETGLRASGCVEQHADDRMSALRAFIEATSATRLADLDGTRASAWLERLRLEGKPKHEGQTTLSARTVNGRRAALCQFGRWLVRERRLAFDPFVGVASLNEDADRRHVRRALTHGEVARVLDAARKRPLDTARGIRVNAGVTDEEETRLRELGETRALVYEFAYRTGLRRGELSRVRWCDLALEGASLGVTIPAKSAKARRIEHVPLDPAFAKALKGHRRAAKTMDLVFPKDVFPSLRTFKQDLLAAGIGSRDEDGKMDFHDEEGRALDFHALRTSLGSHLAAAGVPLATTKALMRHSTAELTLKHYTDPAVLDTRGALEKLAPSSSPGAPSAAQLKVPGSGESASPKVAGSGAPVSPVSLGGLLGGPTVISTDVAALACTSPRPETSVSGTKSATSSPEVADLSSTKRAKRLELSTLSLGTLRTPSGGAAPRGVLGDFLGERASRGPEEVARELLMLAASAPDPAPLVEAARVLLEQARAAREGTPPKRVPAPRSRASGAS